MRVVVDAMGSDRAPGPEVAGALRAVRALPLEVVLVGDAARVDAELARAGRAAGDRVSVVHASQVVAMDDHPAQAFRGKPDSSMRIAVAEVAAGRGDAVVSAGNSGAVLACALFVMGRLPGVERPAIVTVLPMPAASIITPMMLFALIRRPLRVIQTSDWKLPASCVSLADARACSPNLLTMVVSC